MKNTIELHNFLKIHESFPPVLPIPVMEQIKSFFQSRDADSFSDDVKKLYASILLTGALYIRSEEEQAISKNLVALDLFMPTSIIHFIKIPYTYIMCHYNAFKFLRDQLLDNEPELILEIAREHYNRVWAGWGNNKDIGHILCDANYFWEPLVKDLLSEFGGYKVKAEINTHTNDDYFHYALAGLLQFGKAGYFGIPFSVLMASIGTLVPQIPSCIGKDSCIDETFRRMICGNGITKATPSVSEEFYLYNNFANITFNSEFVTRG